MVPVALVITGITFEMVPVALVITGITFAFTFHTHRYILKFLNFFLITFLSPGIATCVSMHVPFYYHWL
jgi:hypothetical protein